MSLIIPTRRGFLGALIGLVAAPAVVKATSLMPLSRLPVEPARPEPTWVSLIYKNINHWQECAGPGYARVPLIVENAAHVKVVEFAMPDDYWKWGVPSHVRMAGGDFQAERQIDYMINPSGDGMKTFVLK